MIEAERQGEELREWFIGVVEGHYASFFATASHYVRDPEVARDMVQSALLTGWEKIATLEDPRKIVGWLRRIVRNRCLDHFVDPRRRKPHAPEDVGEIDPSGEPRAEDFDDTTDVRAALDRVPPKDREVLYLRFYAGLTPTEIAEQAGSTPGAVRVRLHRAVQRAAFELFRLRLERLS